MPVLINSWVLLLTWCHWWLQVTSTEHWACICHSDISFFHLWLLLSIDHAWSHWKLRQSRIISSSLIIIHVEANRVLTFWLLVFFFLDWSWSIDTSKEIMNMVVDEHDPLLILVILLINSLVKLVDDLPIVIVYESWTDVSSDYLPFCFWKFLVNFFWRYEFS